MADRIRSLHCAIYTRKSSEEGLEQDFNSLDAQREACEAFILSQKHEGWTALPALYDDGGFSGGTIGRPAMQRLLADVEARKIDVVVVYKVDRLTRSLADFAKIVEVFDARDVSFVSVTQQFNTTTSMGRLTLNVLLSFAQFEREVTGERIRDKFLASRKKGIWMGGHPPLGYDLKDRKLLINPDESVLARRIFTGYAETGIVRSLKAELDAEGAVSKRRVSAAGIAYGGHPFTTGALYKILGNQVYRGDAVHKGKAYPGEHEAIITQDLWDRVQQRLSANRVRRRNGNGAREASLLAGLLFDDRGRRLTPSHATKGKRRYRYYVTASNGHDDASLEHRPWRIPAHEIEDTIRAETLAMLTSRSRLDAILEFNSISPKKKLATYQAAAARAGVLKQAPPWKFRSFLLCVLGRITIGSESINIEVRTGALEMAIHHAQAYEDADWRSIQDQASGRTYGLRIETRFKRCGSEMKFILFGDDTMEMRARPDPGMIKAVAKARIWAHQLMTGEVSSIAEIAKRERTSRPHASRLLNLAFLAPDIVQAILEGKQPPELNVKAMTRRLQIPLSWEEQRRALGFA